MSKDRSKKTISIEDQELGAGAREDALEDGNESGLQVEALAEETAEPDESELESLRKERDEFCDLLMRKQAEFENYRRRVDKEKVDIRTAAQAELFEELLAVLDACEKGLESMSAEASETVPQVFMEGYELLLKKLRALLDKYEVTEVEGVGATFDPNVHEALVRDVSEDHEEGEILEQYRKGYLIKDRLLRPSQVRVAVQPED
jgi:molecular chaperone GrpE